MTTSSLPAAPAPAAGVVKSMSHRPVTGAITSAALLWVAFPPVDRGFFAWVALVPFFALVRCEARPLRIYLGAWVGGMVFGLLSVSWVGQVDGVGWVLMGLFLSLWWPGAMLAARLGVRRLGLPSILAGPMAWVGLEYARALIFSGFPWYYLAHTQYQYVPLIQVADLAGAWGLSLVVAVVNAAIADLATRPARGTTSASRLLSRHEAIQAAVTVGLLAATAAYGFGRLATRSFRDGPRVALLQTDFPQEYKNSPDPAEMLAQVVQLLGQATRGSDRPDLVVWPETSYPIGLATIAEDLPEARFAELAHAYLPDSTPEGWRGRRERALVELKTLADSSSTPLLVGLTTYAFGRSGLDRYNSACLFEPGSGSGPSSTYHKQALVPVGECFPLIDVFPWLIHLTPYTDGYVPDLTPGTGPSTFQVGGTTYAPIICFEDTLPNLTRRAALANPSGRSADVLVNLTNDGWFRGSSEHRAHLAATVFRAVECRAPLVRAVNTGISAVVDGDGRIVSSLPEATTGVLAAEVPLDGRGSLYLMVGDVLPAALLAGTAGVVSLGLVRRRDPLPFAHPPFVG